MENTILSVCMIVKNEARNIGRCLESIKGLADEIIIVDTGSTDLTKRIVSTYDAKIFDFPWNDSFSDARNFSIEHAIGQWILILDADEVISPKDHLKIKSLCRWKNKERAYIISTRNYLIPTNIEGWIPNDDLYEEQAGTGWFKNDKVRLFPRDNRLRFVFPVHELLEPALKMHKFQIVQAEGIWVHHYGKLDQDNCKVKGEQYYQLGKAKLDEHADPQALMEMALQAGELKHHEEAIELWSRLIAHVPMMAKAHFNLGYNYINLGKWQECYDASKKSIELDPNLKEAYLNYSHSAIRLGKIDEAIETLNGVLVTWPGYPTAESLLIWAHEMKQKKDAFMDQPMLMGKAFEVFVTLIGWEEFYNQHYLPLVTRVEALEKAK